MKRKVLLLFLAVCVLFTVSGVCAADVNDTAVAGEDSNQMELSLDNVMSEDNLQTCERNTTLTQTNDDETLSAGEGTYEDLISEIGNGGDKNLTKSYYRYNGGETIQITTSGVINGNGAIIDMAGSSVRAFFVSVSGVTIKNLTIKNANLSGYGGAIYFKSLAMVENCNFIGNNASCGGAIWMNLGIVRNCNFINNQATAEYGRGGAVVLEEGTVENCNFANNNASEDGGAIGMHYGYVENCKFANNSVCKMGGAVLFYGKGTVTNCKFANNSANTGGAIYSAETYTTVDTCIFKTDSDTDVNTINRPPTLNVDDFITFYGSGKKLTFDLKTFSNMSVYDGNISINVYNKDNDEWIGNYYCLSGEGWAVDLPVGSYYAVFDTEYKNFENINRTITIIPNTTFFALNLIINDNDNPLINLTNNYCYDPSYDASFESGIFVNRKVTINGNGYTIDSQGKARVFNISASDVIIENLTIKNANFSGYGGAIYFNAIGTVTNCNFTNNSGYNGGAVYFYVSGEVTNCTFVNNTATVAGGGAINMLSGTVENCDFTNNSAEYGGAVYFYDIGDITNCTFVNNTATVAEGGAINMLSGTVENCIFTNNTAGDWAGAILFGGAGNVTNCDFTNNSASKGGAILFGGAGNVTNCDFTNNSAEYGGAFCSLDGEVTNCTFVNNFANNNGGAFQMKSGSVTNCTFVNNSANNNSGAVCFLNNGTVTNCNFVNNSASNGGGAIHNLQEYGTADSCIFKTESDTTYQVRILPPTLDVDNFTTLYNSGEKLTFDLRTNSNMSIGNGIISISVYYKNNNSWFGNYSCLSGEGWIVDLPVGSYWAVFNTEYENFTKINRTVTILPNNTFQALNHAINSNNASQVNLTNDYYFNPFYDEEFVNGIVIERTVTVNGNGHTIDARGKAGVFNISASDVTIENLTIKNANSTGKGGAIYFNSNGTVTNCDFTNNQASYGGAVYFTKLGSVINCSFTGNIAKEGGAIWFKGNCNVTNSNFTDNQVLGNDSGGAIYLAAGSLGSVSNCNFVHNSASFKGGAIYFSRSTSAGVENCNFVNNTANTEGGAVCFMAYGNVVNCTFVNNTVSNGDGGAIRMYSANVTNCNFANNVASNRGGAIYNLWRYGTADSCIFKTESDTTYQMTILPPTLNADNFTTFYNSGEKLTFDLRTNSNMSIGNGIISISVYYKNNNSWVGNYSCLSGEGWIVDLPVGSYWAVFNTEYENFTKINRTVTILPNNTFQALNHAINSNNASQVNLTNDYYFNPFYDEEFVNGIVIERTVTVNGNGHTIDARGKAGVFNISASDVTIEDLTIENANSTGNGGAIYFAQSGRLMNCNFAYNSAANGGAVYFMGNGNVANCNFNYNTADRGSAIYFNASSRNDVFNSTFLNNRADAYADNPLRIEADINTVKITFMGEDNLLNAIYSNAAVSFTNVTYWGANGITNTGNSPITPTPSHNEAGQNISVVIVVNDEIVLNEVRVTDENGAIVLDMPFYGKFYIRVVHDEDSYYTEAETVLTMDFYINVTETKTTNKTVNITAKSNILNEVMPGKLVFILPNGTQINATYAKNGTWWAVHTFDDYADYQVNASYIGLDDVTINNATISITRANSTVNLSDVVLDYGDSKNVTVTAEGATGITAKINDNPVAVINNYTIVISGLDAGNYTLTVTTLPDNDHNSITKTVNLTVNKVDSILIVKDVTVVYGFSTNLTVTTDGAIGITAEIEDKNATVEGNTIMIPAMNLGTYTLTVTTVPDSNHNPVTKTASIYVIKTPSTVTVDNVELDYGSSAVVVAKTEGAIGITARIDDKNLTVNNNTIFIPVLDAGTYTLTVTTVPDEGHSAVTANATITVNKLNTQITANAVTTTYNVNKNLVITLKDTKGNALSGAGITINLNGVKTYVTDKNGQVKINVAKLVPKTYAAKITFNGNKNYKASSANAKVTVKKAKSKIVAKKKTFRKSKKIKKYTITLKSGKNPIKKVKVTLKIKKKTYRAKTNAKGKATFKIKKLTKKGTFKATIKFKGNKYYNKATKKVKIKIK